MNFHDIVAFEVQNLLYYRALTFVARICFSFEATPSGKNLLFIYKFPEDRSIYLLHLECFSFEIGSLVTAEVS